MEEVKFIQPSKWVLFFEKIRFLFFWLDWFYPNAKGINVAHKLYCFVPQKIFRINGRASWPVHYTSKILITKNITVGNRSAPGLNIGAYIQAKNGIVIGNNCRFGPHVGLVSANHHIHDYDVWEYADPIYIGDNVWLAMNVVVMPGVRIGNNVIVGANSVVTQDIPDNSIAVGSPCKVIKTKSPYRGELYQ